MIRRPPRSTLFPYTSSSDLARASPEVRFHPPPILGLLDRRHFDGLAVDDQRIALRDRKSTRLNSSHVKISYAVFCLKKKNGTAVAHSHQRQARTAGSSLRRR